MGVTSDRERELAPERRQHGLAPAKAKGVRLGGPVSAAMRWRQTRPAAARRRLELVTGGGRAQDRGLCHSRRQDHLAQDICPARQTAAWSLTTRPRPQSAALTTTGR